jgi:hypothetical protein
MFGLDTVARELRVARHALIFLVQLCGVAALPIVLPVPRLCTEVLTPLSSAAAPAAALTIVDQMPTSLRSSRYPPWALGQAGPRDEARLLTLSFRSALP